MTFKCKGRCVHWKGMINFLVNIPKYVIADYCVTCRIWFPKFMVRYCPCCGHLMRIKRRQNWEGRKDRSNKEIAQMLEFKVAQGWQPLNEKVYDNLMEFVRLERQRRQEHHAT